MARSPLTEEFITALCDRIITAFYFKTAIESMGMSEDVFYKWRRRGEGEIARRIAIEAELGMKAKKAFTDPVSKAEEIYVTFVRSVKKARAQATFRHVLNVQRAALGAPALYERDKTTGDLVLGKDGYPILLQSAVAPTWQASMRLLESAERQMWGRFTAPVQVDSDESDSIAEQFEVHIVDKRTKAPPELADDDE